MDQSDAGPAICTYQSQQEKIREHFIVFRENDCDKIKLHVLLVGNSFVNGSTAISVYVNEYLLVVISLGCWLELTLHFRSENSTYISCNALPTYFVLNFYCMRMMIHHNLGQKKTMS
ncbi:hypothetical protein T07_10381 [Trichinella nelsoni]|uniref:Uncharacterized protein n=1 Tax=Trichinella nelsoni TaxID=6336 RepID=A0A0V0RIU2_9BILA|nr:hypothetical protein T07_10381 [Trichinella nelsoni]